MDLSDQPSDALTVRSSSRAARTYPASSSLLTSAIAGKITGTPAHTYAQWAVDHSDDFR
ncbi:hypothetical protein ABZU45_37560 [Streptomyces avermitilis]|uniref:hypothetical protein n=1 Tax=Streptomyces avermitilis TaxID=33903 RepID=UPI0033AEFDDA